MINIANRHEIRITQQFTYHSSSNSLYLWWYQEIIVGDQTQWRAAQKLMRGDVMKKR